MEQLSKPPNCFDFSTKTTSWSNQICMKSYGRCLTLFVVHFLEILELAVCSRNIPDCALYLLLFVNEEEKPIWCGFAFILIWLRPDFFALGFTLKLFHFCRECKNTFLWNGISIFLLLNNVEVGVESELLQFLHHC